LKEPLRLRVEILDTWAMTVTPVEGIFEARPTDRYLYTCANHPKVPLPGKPYLALRIRRFTGEEGRSAGTGQRR